MRFRVKSTMEDGLITITDDLEGKSWGEVKSILSSNYRISLSGMDAILRTSKDDKTERQAVIPIDATVFNLNDDNVLFLSPTSKVGSGIIKFDDYPDTLQGIQDMADAMIDDLDENLNEFREEIKSRIKLQMAKIDIIRTFATENEETPLDEEFAELANK